MMPIGVFKTFVLDRPLILLSGMFTPTATQVLVAI